MEDTGFFFWVALQLRGAACTQHRSGNDLSTGDSVSIARRLEYAPCEVPTAYVGAGGENINQSLKRVFQPGSYVSEISIRSRTRVPDPVLTSSWQNTGGKATCNPVLTSTSAGYNPVLTSRK